jgi:ribosome-associated protein
MGSILESAEIAKKAVEAALDKQAVDIQMLDIGQIACFADYFVICSADSDRQIRAICDEIDEVLKREGIKVYHREGSEDSGWVLLDFGPVIVHVFATPQREYYEIEKLWGEATPVVRIL